ncbi:MAG: hypothetical protein ACD_54C00597G0001, partial [uncultured bacterium]
MIPAASKSAGRAEAERLFAAFQA